MAPDQKPDGKLANDGKPSLLDVVREGFMQTLGRITVTREWRSAKAWLHTEMSEGLT